MTRGITWIGAALLILAAATLVASAQNPQPRGNAEAGRQFAIRSCDACHIVAANQDLPPMPNYGPSFREIANRSDLTAESLQGFLSKTHRGIKMPDAQLTSAQIADVSAYILSLRSRH